MPPLGRASRLALALAALAAFATAFVLTVTASRGRLDGPHGAPLATRAVAAYRQPVRPERDPFAVPPDAPPDTDPTAAARPLFGALPRALPAPAAPPVHVFAILVGDRPSALLDDGSGPRSVGIGERVASTVVTGIVGDAVVLADGRRIGLTADGGRP